MDFGVSDYLGPSWRQLYPQVDRYGHNSDQMVWLGNVAGSASPDSLAAVAAGVVARQGFDIAEVIEPDTSTRVVIGQKTHGLLRQEGEYIRVRIARDTGDLTTVRVITKPRQLFTLGHRERAPQVFQAMDARLSAEAVGPRLGMRVRAVPLAGGRLFGSVLRLTSDTFVLQLRAGAAPQPFALRDLGGLAVSRGSNSHTREGMLIGVIIGGLVGTAVSSSRDSEGWTPDLGRVVGMLGGAAAGGLLGAAIGASTRTEVWSEVPRRPRR